MKDKTYHPVKTHLLQNRVDVALIGAGGTGSMVLSGLVRLHMSMIACGHPAGLMVKVFDPDKVSDANIGRQLFYRSDIGQNKAQVLVNRLNIALGLDFCAEDTEFKNPEYSRFDIIISCVDSRKSRSKIQLECMSPIYFIDCGNGNDYGQVLMGVAETPSMPWPWKEHPELFDETIPEDNTPSCSLMEALEKQSLFINQDVATACLLLLNNLFRNGGTYHRGYYINQKTGARTAIPLKQIKRKNKKCQKK